MTAAGPNPSGVCMCGCGELTPLAPCADWRTGAVKDRPLRFVNGHQGRRCPADYVVDLVSGCWLWARRLNRQGYGTTNRGGRSQLAHRWYYVQAKGEIPVGLQLDHLCRNPCCVNPDHLEPVTPLENTRRARCTKLTAEAVRAIRTSNKSQRVIAAEHGLSQSHVQRVRAGEVWADA